MAIALAVADEHALGAFIKLSCRVIASQNSTDEIAFFRFSRNAIAFSSHSAQVKAIANPSQSNTIAFTVMGKGDRQPKPIECDRFHKNGQK
jgi:hypothetical protein